MDKYEYKIRADEIKHLIAEKDYAQAVEIADTIDWRRVKSVMMLCTISDLYKINRRYEDARDMLLLAYERRPGGRTICYSLCELSIKMGDFVQAVEYYKEFVQVAPRDSGRYILQYKLYEAQDVSLEERIEVLEELKKQDYREKWAYELAYLYHRVGLATRCVEECDEMILWFGEGKYVIKAMELKMLHQPLSPEQQEKYDHRFDAYNATLATANEQSYEAARDVRADQNYVADQGYGASQGYGEDQNYPTDQSYGVDQNYPADQGYAYDQNNGDEQVSGDTQVYPAVHSTQEVQQPEEDMDIHVKTMDVGQYNTINLQEELAAGLREVLGEHHKESVSNPITRSIVAPMVDSDTETLDYPEIDEVDENDLEPETEKMESTEVFFGETGEIGDTANIVMEQMRREEALEKQAATQAEQSAPAAEAVAEQTSPAAKTVAEQTVPATETGIEQTAPAKEQHAASDMRQLNAEPPRELADVLSQDTDGQISLVMPQDEKAVEKQITGQMNIEDILAEWERMKKENEEKRKEEVRQHVLQQTGTMFTEFEAAVRDGLLEKLEREKSGAKDADSLEKTAEIPEDATASAEEQLPEEAAMAEKSLEEVPAEEEIQNMDEEIPAEDEAQYTEESPSAEEVPESAEDVIEDTDEVEEIEEVSEDNWQWEEDSAEEMPEELPEDAVEELAEEPADEMMEEPAEEAEEAFAEGMPEAEKAFAGEAPETEEELAEENPDEVSEVKEEPKQKKAPVEREQASIRKLTREERELYAPYIQSRSAREQLVQAIDNVSLAAYTGNIIITGEEGMDTLSLAKNMIRQIQMEDGNFSGKVAKISGQAFNKKEPGKIVESLKNGALIIQKASRLNAETAAALYKALQQESYGIVVVLEDTRKAMNHFLENHPKLTESFNARMDVEALSNDTLVAFGRQYAREMEYAIDEMGVLALHTRIADMQTSDHFVTVMEVKEIVDEAIAHANKKSLKHFFDVLLAKRYNDEDMIILGEKDFA